MTRVLYRNMALLPPQWGQRREQKALLRKCHLPSDSRPQNVSLLAAWLSFEPVDFWRQSVHKKSQHLSTLYIIIINGTCWLAQSCYRLVFDDSFEASKQQIFEETWYNHKFRSMHCASKPESKGVMMTHFMRCCIFTYRSLCCTDQFKWCKVKENSVTFIKFAIATFVLTGNLYLLPFCPILERSQAEAQLEIIPQWEGSRPIVGSDPSPRLVTTFPARWLFLPWLPLCGLWTEGLCLPAI